MTKKITSLMFCTFKPSEYFLVPQGLIYNKLFFSRQKLILSLMVIRLLTSSVKVNKTKTKKNSYKNKAYIMVYTYIQTYIQHQLQLFSFKTIHTLNGRLTKKIVQFKFCFKKSKKNYPFNIETTV